MYSQADQLPNSSSQTKHKEEGNKRRKLEFDDRETLSSELAKHSHPLAVQSEVLYNIVNGHVVPADVNVDDAVDIGWTMAGSFRNTLPNIFHGIISNQVKTMQQLKRGIKVCGKTVFDLEAIFNSAKDDERIRRGVEGSTDYNQTINSPLPNRYAILMNKRNKLELSRILSTLDITDADMSIDSRYNGSFEHDKAGVTMVAYLLQAAESGKSVIRILTDDTDVFVLPVYWVWKMQSRWNVGTGW